MKGWGPLTLDAPRGKTSVSPLTIPFLKGQKSSWGDQEEPCWLQRGLSLLIPVLQPPTLPLPTLYSKYPEGSHLSTFVHTPPPSPVPSFPVKVTVLCTTPSRPGPSKSCLRTPLALLLPLLALASLLSREALNSKPRDYSVCFGVP